MPSSPKSPGRSLTTGPGSSSPSGGGGRDTYIPDSNELLRIASFGSNSPTGGETKRLATNTVLPSGRVAGTTIVLQFFENGERKFVHTMDIQELALKRLSDLQVRRSDSLSGSRRFRYRP